MKDKTVIIIPEVCGDDFYLKPRGLLNTCVRLHPDAHQAILRASSIIKISSRGQYKLVVTRGYVHWGLLRRLKGKIGRALFFLLFPKEKNQSKNIFGANGHEDGLSVDVILYDVPQRKFLQFLTWRNVFISKKKAYELLESYHQPISLLNQAMETAGFQSHEDPREKLQAHYRFLDISTTAF
jgi:D-alanyl-D-alanine dipeptidase